LPGGVHQQAFAQSPHAHDYQVRRGGGRAVFAGNTTQRVFLQQHPRAQVEGIEELQPQLPRGAGIQLPLPQQGAELRVEDV